MTMMGFGLAASVMGRITDRFGIVAAMAASICFLGFSYIAAGLSASLWQFIAISFLMGLGTSATFAPLMAEASHWFERYRGLAVTIVASGNYVAGTVWPPLINWGNPEFRLAHDPYRDRDFLRGLDDAAGAGAARPDRRREGARSRQRAAAAGRFQAFDQRADDAVCIAVSHAAWRWRCPRSTSSPIAAISAMAWRAAPRCCR